MRRQAQDGRAPRKEGTTVLQVIISPAKKMRTAQDAFDAQGIPPFPEKTAALLARLRGMGRAELQALWKTSDKLTDAAWNELRALEAVPQTADELRGPLFTPLLSPAIFSYEGIQYQSMAPGVMDAEALAWLQEHLWILSGFYGCVRPFDAVAPYRLEMGAKLSMPADAATGRRATRDLYAYWGNALACVIAEQDLASEETRSPVRASKRGLNGACGAKAGREPIATPMKKYGPGHAHGKSGANEQAEATAGDRRAETAPRSACGMVVNLASVEYAKAVLPHLPESTHVVTCVFGESLRNGKPVQRATASKIARGSMVRWMAERRVEDPAELTRFDVGCAFSPELSTVNETGRRTLVFMRR